MAWYKCRGDTPAIAEPTGPQPRDQDAPTESGAGGLDPPAFLLAAVEDGLRSGKYRAIVDQVIRKTIIEPLLAEIFKDENMFFQKTKLTTTVEILVCPFCGSAPEAFEYNRSIEGGDYRFCAVIKCADDDCAVRPLAAIDGERGYRIKTELTNDQARDLVVANWNCRAGDDAADLVA